MYDEFLATYLQMGWVMCFWRYELLEFELRTVPVLPTGVKTNVLSG